MNEAIAVQNPANPNMDELRQLELLDRDDLIEMVKKMVSGGISLSFYGKRTAYEIDRRVKPRQTRILKHLCVGTEEEQAKNALIEGENLQALVTLHKFRGQTDLILTDPPYNTGEDFRYNDKWDSDPNDPDLGFLVSKEDGARHTKWMKAMLPRLKMMKAMLKPSGVIAMCIDHRELFRLGLLMDEIFGEANRIAIINWQKSYAAKSQDNHVSTGTEYVLIYSKEKERATTNLLERDEGMNSLYVNEDEDPRGPWRDRNPTASGFRKNTVFGIQSPFTGMLHYPEEIHPFDGSKIEARKHWRGVRAYIKGQLETYGVDYEERDLKDGRGKALVVKGSTISLDNYEPSGDAAIVSAREIATTYCKTHPFPDFHFSNDRLKRFGYGRPFFKIHLNAVKQGKVPLTFWASDDYENPVVLGTQSWGHVESGHSQAGVNELDDIVGKGHGFSTVKPLRLFKKILQLWCPPDGLVLDPYAGSGTTGHAILELNDEVEGSERRFILVEQGAPEKGDKYAKTLTFERLKRAISGERVTKQGKVAKSAPKLKGGFRYQVLTQTVDAKAVLTMRKDELIDIVIVSHWDDKKRKSNLVRIDKKGNKYLVGKDDSNNGYFVIWNGGDAVESFNEKAYKTVVQEAKDAGLVAPYYVYARHEFYQAKSVIFHKIPDKILAHLGLNESSDSYNLEDEG